MSTATFGSPIREMIGDAVSPLTLATTVPTTNTSHLVEVQPGYHEVVLYCPNQWKLLLTPKMKHCILYNASTYVDYIARMVDKAVTPVLTLSSMTTTWALYFGFPDQVSGLAWDMTAAVNGNAQLATIYYWKDATVDAWADTSATDNTVSGGKTLAQDGTMTWSVPTDEIPVTFQGSFSGTIADGTGACTGSPVTLVEGVNTITVTTLGNFTVTLPAGMTGIAAGGTAVLTSSPVSLVAGAQTIATSSIGTITLTLITDVPRTEPLYWYKMLVDGALDSATTVERVLGINKSTNYTLMEPGMSYMFSVNTDKVGALQALSVANTPALDIGWVKH